MLTRRSADALRYDPVKGGRQVAWDGEVPGFGLRVYPSGRKAWVLFYRNAAGRARAYTIGPYPAIAPREARRRARVLVAAVAEGRDPLEERRGARGGAKVRDLAEEWVERHAKPRNRSWREQKRLLEKYVLPVLGARRVVDVRRADVARLHGRIGERSPTTANRVHEVIRAMFEKARAWGYLPEDAPNPARGIERFPERSRDRWARPHELRRLLESIEAEEDPFLRALFRLYLLTGCRRGELLSARWEDWDPDTRTLTIRRPKGRGPAKARRVPLSAAAADILAGLPRFAGNPYIFPSPTRPGRPRVNVAKAWDRVRTRANLDDLRLHDLRRTVGSTLASAGVGLAIIKETLGHSSTRAAEVYARIASEAAREALERHAALVEAATRAPDREEGTA